MAPVEITLAPAEEGQPTREYLRDLVAVTRRWTTETGFHPAQWMLDNGRICGDWSPLPAGVRRGPMKGCYWNSINLAKRGRGRYVYCEGYAANIIPVEHAWCLDRETGLVVDPTWEWGIDYIGLPCRWEYARQCLSRDCEAVLNWKEDFPVMTGALPPEVWKVEL